LSYLDITKHEFEEGIVWVGYITHIDLQIASHFGPIQLYHI